MNDEHRCFLCGKLLRKDAMLLVSHSSSGSFIYSSLCRSCSKKQKALKINDLKLDLLDGLITVKEYKRLMLRL